MSGRGWGTEGGGGPGLRVAGAGNDVIASNAISACGAGIAGRDGGVSDA